MGRKILAAVLAAFWISASEFLRNQVLIKSLWVDHYRSLGLAFPSTPVNGMVWGVWCVLLAIAVLALSTRFRLWQTIAIVWLMGFVMMWVVIGNLGVLPPGLLRIAVPWSLLECAVAGLIVTRVMTLPKTG